MLLTILEMEFDGRSVRNLAKPYVQILSFAGFEEEDVVAVVQLGEFVQFVEAGLGVEFGILSTVRKHGSNIV